MEVDVQYNGRMDGRRRRRIPSSNQVDSVLIAVLLGPTDRSVAAADRKVAGDQPIGRWWLHRLGPFFEEEEWGGGLGGGGGGGGGGGVPPGWSLRPFLGCTRRDGEFSMCTC